MQHEEQAQARGAIEVDLEPFGPMFDARVRLNGEHDLATSRELVHALARLEGDVLVDLTACEFIDSTIIGALLNDAQARTRAGTRLELLVPPENLTVSRTLAVSGAVDLIPIHTSLSWV